MRDLIGLFSVGVASALVPLINIEAYLGVRAAVSSVGNIWVLGLVAAVGQMVGKVVWYYLGANSLSWGWIRRKVEQPKNAARLETWRARTHDRPLVAGVMLFASALLGFPPFAIVAVLAGQLRMSLTLFLGLGLTGRWLRFVAVLGGAQWLLDALR
ncbi:MAG: VTT domain-containing protein [Nocardioides sp.]